MKTLISGNPDLTMNQDILRKPTSEGDWFASLSKCS